MLRKNILNQWLLFIKQKKKKKDDENERRKAGPS